MRAAMASATAGSAACFRVEIWVWRSLMVHVRWDGGTQSASLLLQASPQINDVLTPADVTLTSRECLPRLDDKQRRAIRLGRHHADWHHRRLVGKLDPKSPDQLGQRQGRLDQREMRADADARASAERHVGEAFGR